MKGLSPYGAVWAGPRNYNFKWHQIQWEKLCFGVRGRLEMRCQICRLIGGGVKREEQALHVKGTREDGNSVNAQNVPWRGKRDVKCQVPVYNVPACVAGSRSFKDAQKSFICCNIPLAFKPVHFTVVSKVLVGFFLCSLNIQNQISHIWKRSLLSHTAGIFGLWGTDCSHPVSAHPLWPPTSLHVCK